MVNKIKKLRNTKEEFYFRTQKVSPKIVEAYEI